MQIQTRKNSITDNLLLPHTHHNFYATLLRLYSTDQQIIYSNTPFIPRHMSSKIFPITDQKSTWMKLLRTDHRTNSYVGLKTCSNARCDVGAHYCSRSDSVAEFINPEMTNKGTLVRRRYHVHSFIYSHSVDP
jgi:hypothetical protein